MMADQGAFPAAGEGVPSHPVIRRADYRAPEYLIDEVDLDVRVDSDTRVVARLRVRRNPESGAATGESLKLDARGLAPIRIEIDGVAVPESRMETGDDRLVILGVPDAFELLTEVRLDPERNTALEGFYASGPMYCTQCEAHGFSRITPFPDRPDVLSRYRVRLSADRARFPVLLANGNLIESGDEDGGRHYAVWEDPHAKPCYLFAMVVGDLALVEDRYRTGSGRDVRLCFYVDAGNEGRVAHAMDALKRSMAWDEQVYGLEYDLDIYMVVAARAFNMGAMENKGLNIFNAAYVLASTDTATDDEYDAVEAVIAHEYFHNYTGNRVTCRDWFQLSLKEGLTVFREHQFCEDMGSAGVRRIEQVRTLRALQFPEDAGPTSHPVRPEAYVEVNNFYTATVYEKGSEIVRMLRTLLGDHNFNAGVRRYLREQDGRAATIEDFVDAHARESGQDLEAFSRWYAQAGTPVLNMEREWDPDRRVLRISLRQRTEPTPGQPVKRALPLPLRITLWDVDGSRLPLPPHPARRGDDLLLMEDETLELEVSAEEGAPLPALLHGFSAPVRLETDYTLLDLQRLCLLEADPFVRWEAVQQLFARAHARLMRNDASAVDALLLTLQRVATAPSEDRALTASLLRFPDLAWLADQYSVLDVDAFMLATETLRLRVAQALCGPLSVWAQQTPEQAGGRALTNVALAYLSVLASPATLKLARQRAEHPNMTLALGALSALNDAEGGERAVAVAAFHERWRGNGLVLDKWFGLEAGSAVHGVADIRALMENEDFEWRNPNRVRAVLGAFARRNLRAFHSAEGYALYAEVLARLDGINPQVAARLSRPLLGWKRLAGPWAELQREALETLRAKGVSRDLGEMLSAALDGD